MSGSKRRSSVALLCAAVIGTTMIALVAVGTPDRRTAPPTLPRAAPPAAQVAANGFALSSTAVTLPEDTSGYPDAPNVAAMAANCTACHSPAMVTAQPPLSHDQWEATVTKMREVYRAPIADAAVPAILAYLDGLSARAAAPPNSLRDATRADAAR